MRFWLWHFGLRAAVVPLAFLLSLGIAHAGPVEDCRAELAFGEPAIASLGVDAVCHPKAYLSFVDRAQLVPRFVGYRLTGPHTLGCLPRASGFHVDEQLAGVHHAWPGDYDKSGYDLGHQAPAQDMAWDVGVSHDSFSMANVAPQLPGLNRAEWERLEETVRAWALDRGELQIYVGALPQAKGAIGADKVAVPAGFYKVVVDVKSQALGFVMPNRAIAKGDLAPWQTSVAAIEAALGFKLPLPAGIDREAHPALWPADLAAWHKAHKAACPAGAE